MELNELINAASKRRTHSPKMPSEDSSEMMADRALVESARILQGKPPIPLRPKQVCVRYTAKEFQQLRRKITRSGMSQGEYIRRISLEGSVICRTIPDADDMLIDEIASIRSFLGRLGGLLKMIRNAYEAQHVGSPKCEDWMAESSRTLIDLKAAIANLEERLNGYH